MDRLALKYGEEEARRMRKKWGSKGGKNGGNGLQQLTSKDKSLAGKKGREVVLTKYSEEQRKQWSSKGGKKKYIDGIHRKEGVS